MLDHRKDIAWINMLRAICIMAVYYVHVQIYYDYYIEPLRWFVHAFYVNAFFFVSGYLLFRKHLVGCGKPDNDKGENNGEKVLALESIIYRIVIPSSLFALIEFFPKHVLRGDGIDINDLVFETIGGGTYWFTSSLVVAELIFVLLLLLRIKNIWIYAVSVLPIVACGLYLFSQTDTDCQPPYEIWAWRRGLVAYGYLVAGGLYCKYEKLVDKYLNTFVCVLLLCPVIASNQLQELSQTVISTYEVTPLGIVYSLIAIKVVISACRLIPSCKAMTFIGQYSLCYYFLSGALPILLSMIMHKIYGEPDFIGFVTVMSLAMAISTAITYILNRYMPCVFDIRKKINKNIY